MHRVLERLEDVSHVPIKPYFGLPYGMFDESVSDVGTVGLQGSGRARVAAGVRLVRLDMEEMVVDVSRRGACAVLPFPAPHLGGHYLETRRP